MGKNPEVLFEEATDRWMTSGMSHQETIKVLEGYENVLLLLGHGDYDNSEDKNPSYRNEDGYHYDNLTQKVYVWQGMAFFCALEGQGLFREGMLAFDKAIQINPENATPHARKIECLEFYIDKKKRSGDRKQTGYDQHYPELSKELIKACDKLLSIDKKNLGAWVSKGLHLSNLKRYDEALECSEMKLKLFQECDDIIVNIYTGKKAGANDKQVQAWKKEQMVINWHSKAFCYFSMRRAMEEKRCLLEILKIDPYNEQALMMLHEAEIDIELKEKIGLQDKKLEALGVKKQSLIKAHPLYEKLYGKEEDTSAFCENCGKPLKPTAKFCGKCGTPRT
jgi:tetratricopeptide (TPR) repeat protein